MRLLLSLCFGSLLLPCTAVCADEASILWVDTTCNYFIAALDQEFGIYQWRSGPSPKEGETMNGPLRATGMLTVNVAQKNETNSVILVAMSGNFKSLVNSSPVQCKRRYEKQP